MTCKTCKQEPIKPPTVEMLPDCKKQDSFSTPSAKPTIVCQEKVVVVQPDKCA